MSANPPTPAAARGNVRLQRWLLRIAAVISFITLPAILLPRQTIEKLSWMVGFGRPPQSALLLYFGAGGSFVYVALGVFFWLFSNDAVRYRPLVLASAWISLLGAPAFLWIDWQCGLPAWWIAMDSFSCLLFGAALLWACSARKE
jgi:hypothetical protein